MERNKMKEDWSRSTKQVNTKLDVHKTRKNHNLLSKNVLKCNDFTF